MRDKVKKPGFMARAVIAWCILNAILFLTLAAVVWLLGGLLHAWYVAAPIVVGVIISEWIIMSETIAPIIKEWITQETWVETDND